MAVEGWNGIEEVGYKCVTVFNICPALIKGSVCMSHGNNDTMLIYRIYGA